MTVTGLSSTIDASDAELDIFREDVRMLMRDVPGNNVLLDDVQFTDEDILRAIRLAANQYNTLPPNGNVGWRLIPEHILFLLTASWLLLSESFLQIRNQVSVPSDGLGVIGIDDKWSQYAQLRESLRAQGLEAAKQYKVQQNLETAYGSLASGYAYVSRFNRT